MTHDTIRRELMRVRAEMRRLRDAAIEVTATVDALLSIMADAAESTRREPTPAEGLAVLAAAGHDGPPPVWRSSDPETWR